MVLKSFIMDFVRGRGSNNTVKGIKDSIRETNLGKHHQSILGEIQMTLCKYRKSTMDEDRKDASMLSEGREPRLKVVGYKPRVKRDFLLSREERKVDGQSNYHLHI